VSVIVVVILGLSLIFVRQCALPKPGWKHTEGEAISNLHAIQLAIERFYEKNGYYPEYLIGGSRGAGGTRGRTQVSPDVGAPTQRDNLSYDPLIDGGFLPGNEYPRWPGPVDDFTLRYFELLQAEFADEYVLSSSCSRFISLDDTSSPKIRMGNVGADHRYPRAKWGFPFWLRSTESTGLISLTSQFNFYYKSLRSPKAAKPDGYILMLFGFYRTRGIDAFTNLSYGHELDGRLPDGSGVGAGVPVIPELGIKGDGKPDGVILVLHGGWPWSVSDSE